MPFEVDSAYYISFFIRSIYQKKRCCFTLHILLTIRVQLSGKQLRSSIVSLPVPNDISWHQIPNNTRKSEIRCRFFRAPQSNNFPCIGLCAKTENGAYWVLLHVKSLNAYGITDLGKTWLECMELQGSDPNHIQKTIIWMFVWSYKPSGEIHMIIDDLIKVLSVIFAGFSRENDVCPLTDLQLQYGRVKDLFTSPSASSYTLYIEHWFHTTLLT